MPQRAWLHRLRQPAEILIRPSACHFSCDARPARAARAPLTADEPPLSAHAAFYEEDVAGRRREGTVLPLILADAAAACPFHISALQHARPRTTPAEYAYLRDAMPSGRADVVMRNATGST